MGKIQKGQDRLRLFLRRLKAADIPAGSAVLAFHSLLALVPVVALLFWYLRHLPLMNRSLDLMRAFVANHLGFTHHPEFLQLFAELTSRSVGKHWGVLGVAFLVYTSWNLIHRFGASLDWIIHRDTPLKLSISQQGILLLRRTFVLLVLPVALTLSLTLTHWVRRDSWLRDLLEIETVGSLFALPLAWSATVFAVFAIYFFIPRKSVPWKSAFIAALVVAPSLELVRFFLGWYNVTLVLREHMFGVMTSVPLFILWMQLAWAILLFGALLIPGNSNSNLVARPRRLPGKQKAKAQIEPKRVAS